MAQHSALPTHGYSLQQLTVKPIAPMSRQQAAQHAREPDERQQCQAARGMQGSPRIIPGEQAVARAPPGCILRSLISSYALYRYPSRPLDNFRRALEV